MPLAAALNSWGGTTARALWKKGKLADIVAIDGDPLKDMRDMDKKSMNSVMKEGVIYKKDDLPVVR